MAKTRNLTTVDGILEAAMGKEMEAHEFYGTVSLSRRYQPLSILLMEQFLTAPDITVKAKKPFAHPQHPELSDYLAKYPPDINRLEWLVKQIEPDGKGLPILLKQYHQLGARFYCIGIDPNFAGTPGLLLSVNLSVAPKKLLKRYIGNTDGLAPADHLSNPAAGLHKPSGFLIERSREAVSG